MHTTSELPRFLDLTLILTEQCNLRCSYCYVPKRDRVMSKEVALRAADFLIDRAPPDAKLSLSFFGGEPLLCRELMGQVMDYARQRRPEGLTFGTPTNGTLVDQQTAELIGGNDMRLAVSIDTTGEGSGHTLDRLRAGSNLEHLRQLSPLVRMTVTPQNVFQLFEGITTLFAEGFAQIMHQPALEQTWPERAIEVWREQHLRLADWACERHAQGLPLPDVTVLEGIVKRLAGLAASYCGAGVRMAAVAPDGKIYGCFRSVYDPRAHLLVLGDLFGGPVDERLVAAYAQLHPHRAKPEQGPCKVCDARDGCTVYCAAMGHVLLGNLRGISTDACRLMQIQVEVCRDMIRRMRRSDRRQRRKVGSHVAAAALALSLAGGVAGCGDDEPKKDGQVGGLCPVQTDAQLDGIKQDGLVGGICPPPLPDGPVGGLCPVQVDAAPDGPVGGICPVQPDGMVGGVCPVPAPDGSTPGPGIC